MNFSAANHAHAAAHAHHHRHIHTDEAAVVSHQARLLSSLIAAIIAGIPWTVNAIKQFDSINQNMCIHLARRCGEVPDCSAEKATEMD